MLKAILAKIADIATALVVAILSCAGFVLPAAAASEEFIYCKHVENELLVEEGNRKVFYSAVFLADYSNRIRYELDFAKHVKNNLGGGLGDTSCYFERDESRAQSELHQEIRDDERLEIYDGVVRTNWAPDTFSNQALRDFHMKLDDDSGQIQVCMRDHECEDGDRVRVSVDGAAMLEGEIYNDWDCESFTAQAGREYAIKLYAINGTGRTGNCSYRDVNTGEIRVSAENSQIHSWQHRGGAGSSAKIIVSLSEQARQRKQNEAQAQSENEQTEEEAPRETERTEESTPRETERTEAPTPETNAAPRQDNPTRRETTGRQNNAPAPTKPKTDPNLCEFANDGECDEPHFCEPGTDGNDCN